MAGSDRSAEGGRQERKGFVGSRWGGQASGTASLSHLANELTKINGSQLCRWALKQPPPPAKKHFLTHTYPALSLPSFLPRRMSNHTEAYPKYLISLPLSSTQHSATHRSSHSTGQSLVIYDGFPHLGMGYGSISLPG